MHVESYTYDFQDKIERRGIACAGIRGLADLAALWEAIERWIVEKRSSRRTWLYDRECFAAAACSPQINVYCRERQYKV
jgi:hypothetical protein